MSQTLYNDMVDFIEDEITDFEVDYKDENTLQKILGVLSYPFNKNYMSHFTTTFYPKVYFPTREFVSKSYTNAMKTLAHEYVHLWDKAKNWFWDIGYAMPQPLGLLSLLALLAIPFSNWHLLSLLWMLFFLPLPAPWRMKAELRGYTMSIAVNYWRHGSVKQSTKDWIIKAFIGPSYYFMWPFKKNITDALNTAEQKIIDGTIFDGPEGEVFLKVHTMLKEKGYAKT